MQELFENLGINWKLLLAQALNFLLVLWVFHRFVFKKLLAYLEERKTRIAKGIENAERAKRELQRIDEMRSRAMANMKHEEAMMVQEAKRAAETQSREILHQAKAKEDAMLLKARGDAKILAEDLVAKAKEEIQKRAFMLAEKVLGRAITPKDEQRFLKEALKNV